MGSRGYPIVVRGILRGTGGSYSEARQSVQAEIDAIENYNWELESDYTFAGKTYYSVVWNKMELLPDNKGTVYHYTSAGSVIVNFIAQGRALI